ncbi:MAG TPA: UvrB/UvrC motif-containing protein [Pyrinomonadaceae bacterium]|jgi:excinuclease ABC subunit C
MKHKPENKFSLARQRLFPHFKLTAEKFPRLLATRKILTGGVEYFGAFLPETGVRFLIDFLNKTFRLRTCELEIDGQFNVPCPQFYRKRCVAPCVANLCDETEYAGQVELVRLFLQRKTRELEEKYRQKIEAAAESFEFERAAELRDEWLSIEKIFAAKDWNFWLSDAVDTFEITESEDEFFVYLVSMRGRKTLGKRTFVFEKTGKREEILPAILPEFYRFHAPKEIRVSEDFTERFALAGELSQRFNRPIKISVARENEPKVMTTRALGRTKYEHELRQIRREKTAGEIQSELKEIFDLRRMPERIEAFDAAHISGTDFTAAKSVWENGKFLGKEYAFWLADEDSELETLRKFIEFRFAQSEGNFPALVLIDGGRAHLQAALRGLANLKNREFAVVSAVKPRGQHGEIAYFLTESGAQIEFDGASAAHRVLQTLRDEAHNLSNEIHCQRRETAHFYELAAALPSIEESDRRALLKAAGSVKNLLKLSENDLTVLVSPEKAAAIRRDLQNYRNGNSPKTEPLIVPLRYVDENGDAQDLRPLANYRTA